MNIGLMIIIFIVYMLVTRVLGNFLINLSSPSDRRDEQSIVIALWVPLLGELILFIGLAFYLSVGLMIFVDEKTNKAAQALRKRLGK